MYALLLCICICSTTCVSFITQMQYWIMHFQLTLYKDLQHTQKEMLSGKLFHSEHPRHALLVSYNPTNEPEWFILVEYLKIPFHWNKLLNCKISQKLQMYPTGGHVKTAKCQILQHRKHSVLVIQVYCKSFTVTGLLLQLFWHNVHSSLVSSLLVSSVLHNIFWLTTVHCI